MEEDAPEDGALPGAIHSTPESAGPAPSAAPVEVRGAGGVQMEIKELDDPGSLPPAPPEVPEAPADVDDADGAPASNAPASDAPAPETSAEPATPDDPEAPVEEE